MLFQKELRAALKQKDIQTFRKIIDANRADPEEIDDDTNLSVFDLACQTPDRYDFIKECIYFGCDVNKVKYYDMTNKRTIFKTSNLAST